MKTLLIAGGMVSLATNLGMGTVLLTRRTYPGFGYWTAGTLCRTAGGLLILMRGGLPLWATVVLGNVLVIGQFALNLHGLQMFRGRPTHGRLLLAALLSFGGLLAWYSYAVPDVNSRIVLFCLYACLFELWTVAVLLTRRPGCFGSGDWLLAVTLGVAAGLDLIRAWYTLWLEGTLADLLTAHTQALLILFSLMATLLVALGQIIVNAQRIEYDYRLAQQRLEADIAERERMESALRDSERRFRLAFDNANTGMALVGLDGRLLHVNDRLVAIFGYSRAELKGMGVSDLAIPEDAGVSERFMQAAVRGAADSAMFEKRYIHKQGQVVYGQVSSSLVRDGHGEPLYFISQVQDITERKRMEAVLQEQATRDPLTGLHNRRYLDDTLPRELAHCQRDGEPLTVAMLDLDRFKRFNDDYGHEAGDAVLRAVGKLMLDALRERETACRYGGEELVLILPGTGLAAAATRLDSLRQAVARLPLRYRSGELPSITVSIGLAAARPHDVDAAALLARADAALYRAKAQGRNGIVTDGWRYP